MQIASGKSHPTFRLYHRSGIVPWWKNPYTIHIYIYIYNRKKKFNTANSVQDVHKLSIYYCPPPFPFTSASIYFIYNLCTVQLLEISLILSCRLSRVDQAWVWLATDSSLPFQSRGSRICFAAQRLINSFTSLFYRHWDKFFSWTHTHMAIQPPIQVPSHFFGQNDNYLIFLTE